MFYDPELPALESTVHKVELSHELLRTLYGLGDVKLRCGGEVVGKVTCCFRQTLCWIRNDYCKSMLSFRCPEGSNTELRVIVLNRSCCLASEMKGSYIK